MAGLLERLKEMKGFAARGEMSEAPDGSRDVLRSGKWTTHQLISPELFPTALLLTRADRGLAKKIEGQVVLHSQKVGSHEVELLLNVTGPKAVDLSLRVPTAANQFKDPYILLEAEPGNSREDAVREICFHLQGRVLDAEVARADWAAFFKTAAEKLDAIRKY